MEARARSFTRISVAPFVGGGAFDRLARLFGLAGAGEDALHGVVALVAGVFVDRPLGRVERHFARDGLRVGPRVVDGELVADLVRADPGQPLGDLRPVAAAAAQALFG